jgi:hypothetical protein
MFLHVENHRSESGPDEVMASLKKESKSIEPTAFLDITIGMRVVSTIRNECSEGGYTDGSLGMVVGIMYDKDYNDDVIQVTKDQAAVRPPPLSIVRVRFYTGMMVHQVI